MLNSQTILALVQEDLRTHDMTIFNFEMLNVPFANGAISTEIAPFPDWNRGLGIAFDQTEGKPEMKGLNGLFQVPILVPVFGSVRSRITCLLSRPLISEWGNPID